MTTIFEAYTIPIIVALLIGIVVAFWLFRGRDDKAIGDIHRPGETVEAPPPAVSAPEPAPPADLVEARPETPSPKPARADGAEGNSLLDQGAAATTDVAGQVLGVPVHGELPGASGPPDNLQTMKGVGPKLAALLNDQGITRFDQLAALDAAGIERIEEHLGAFKGRLTRDRVPEQAAYLARGDKDGFEAKFGKLG